MYKLQADIENRIDGADLVSKVLELLVSDLASKGTLNWKLCGSAL